MNENSIMRGKPQMLFAKLNLENTKVSDKIAQKSTKMDSSQLYPYDHFITSLILYLNTPKSFKSKYSKVFET